MDDLLELTARAEADHFWFHGFRSFVAPLLHRVAAGRDDLTLLDCGCGTGHNLGLLRPHGTAVGFDLMHSGAARARHHGWRVAQGDVTCIPFSSDTFDVATSFDVLQCVPDAAAGVREMRRVLKPGGVLVLTLAAFDMLRGDHAEAWQEVKRYTPRDAQRLVEEAGLRLERVSFMFATLFPLMVAARLSQRLLRPFRALRPDRDIGVPAAPINALLTSLVRTEALVARILPMPIGSSLLVVARKPL
jgi:ubiquinone/menaquinone biosynthesis C-methylase UbiE